MLFTNDYDPEPGGHQHYDVFKDGKTFLMIKNERMAPKWIHLVANAIPETTPARRLGSLFSCADGVFGRNKAWIAERTRISSDPSHVPGQGGDP
ncbi:MAG: hypothetical protein O7E54_02095 [Planctomycetota bacterium]|nr:hypothetical protein [Planctomycetota bacterium]